MCFGLAEAVSQNPRNLCKGRLCGLDTRFCGGPGIWSGSRISGAQPSRANRPHPWGPRVPVSRLSRGREPESPKPPQKPLCGLDVRPKKGTGILPGMKIIWARLGRVNRPSPLGPDVGLFWS